MTLGIMYHMPFWQAADGSLWEAEGSFARYVDSLAPYFDEIRLAVPVFDTPPATGSRVQASNVHLAPLPYFPGPRQFYPKLAAVRARLREWVQRCDAIHLRVPTPAGIFGFRLARAYGKPIFLLVVGDYHALLPHLPYRGAKRTLFSAYVQFEEWALRHMTHRALTFTNGPALRQKHERDGVRAHETRTTTIRREDIATREDTCGACQVRLLSVSRIDPRKGLRVLPAAVAELVADGLDVTLDLVGPTIGRIGETERDAIRTAAAALGVGDRVRLLGPVALDGLMPLYRHYDLFVLPTRPGEGIPRVLMEAMAAGLPVITTAVAGIGGLVRNRDNGILMDDSSSGGVVRAVKTLVESPELRQRIIQQGYETAGAHTLERQAAQMMRVVETELGLVLAVVPGAA